MSVIWGENRADFEITHDGQVDEKSKDACTDKIPEAHGHEEVEHPLVRKRDGTSAGVVSFSNLDEIPGVKGEEGQGNNLHGGEQSCKCHVHVRQPCPVPVVAGAD